MHSVTHLQYITSMGHAMPLVLMGHISTIPTLTASSATQCVKLVQRVLLTVLPAPQPIFTNSPASASALKIIME